jgi:hypothetical protein
MTVMVASCWSRTQQLQVHGDDSGHMRRRRKIAGEDHATGTARVRSFWIRGPAAGNVTARSHDGNREKKRCETCADIWGRHSVQLADVTWRSCPMLREKVKALASGSLEKLPTMATPPWSKATRRACPVTNGRRTKTSAQGQGDGRSVPRTMPCAARLQRSAIFPRLNVA